MNLKSKTCSRTDKNAMNRQWKILCGRRTALKFFLNQWIKAVFDFHEREELCLCVLSPFSKWRTLISSFGQLQFSFHYGKYTSPTTKHSIRFAKFYLYTLDINCNYSYHLMIHIKYQTLYNLCFGRKNIVALYSKLVKVLSHVLLFL